MKSQLLFATMIGLLCVKSEAQNTCSPSITSGLVVYLPFCGNANDMSGNANNGTVNVATLTTDRFGNANSAYDFNGSTSYIDLATTTTVNFPSGVSFCAWVSPSAFANSSVVDDMSGSGNGFRINVRDNSSPSPIFYAHTGNYNVGISATSTSQYALNNWFFMVGTWGTDDSVRIYVNGVKEKTIHAPYNYSNSLPVYIGRGRQSSVYEFFNGKIDDVSIYNRALAQSEITQLFNTNLCYTTITVTDTLVINANLTNINPVTFKHTIKIYPNPTNDQITIHYGNYTSLAGYTLKIMNSLSQVVFTTTITQQTSSVNLSSWTGNGVYFVHLIDTQSNTLEIRKIVLQ